MRHGRQELALGVVGGLRLQQQCFLFHQPPLLCNILPHPNHTHDRARYIPPRGGVEEHLHPPVVLCVEWELEVCGSFALQRVLKHLPDGHPKVGRDIDLHQVLPKHLLPAEPSDLGGLVVPLVDQPARVDAEDGGVGRVDEVGKLLVHARPLNLRPLVVCDVLPDCDNTYRVTRYVSACTESNEHNHNSVVLGLDRTLEVRRQYPAQPLVADGPDGLAGGLSNERVAEVKANHLVLGVSCDGGDLFVPLVD
mmetsp:Transcript_41044/g.95208  ORF Transcript_41044/g.95208 Transcript_41044/m.95208 type:complete len:251 (-) Transcript_41044:654-1406(-)